MTSVLREDGCHNGGECSALPGENCEEPRGHDHNKTQPPPQPEESEKDRPRPSHPQHRNVRDQSDQFCIAIPKKNQATMPEDKNSNENAPPDQPEKISQAFPDGGLLGNVLKDTNTIFGYQFGANVHHWVSLIALQFTDRNLGELGVTTLSRNN